MERPAIGDPAPPIDLPAHGRDTTWSLAEHQRNHPGRAVAVIFHRHIH